MADYTKLSEYELKREFYRIAKEFRKRKQDSPVAKANAKTRLDILLQNPTTDIDRYNALKKISEMTPVEFLSLRNSGLTVFSEALYELKKVGLDFKSV